MREKSQLLLEHIESDDDGVNQIRELMERWKHRLTAHNLAITERYAKGELRVLVEFSLLPMRNSVKFCALFEGICPRENGWNGHYDLLRSAGELEGNASGQMGGTTNKKQTVFVAIVKQMQTHQVFIPSSVRVESVDHLYRLWGDSLYFSGRFGFVMLQTLFADRERGIVVGGLAVRQNQLPDKMVKGGSEVLENISDDKGKIFGNRFTLTQLYDEVSSLRLSLSDERIGIGWFGEKAMNPSIQVSDVMFGPFDFEPNGFGSLVHSRNLAK